MMITAQVFVEKGPHKIVDPVKTHFYYSEKRTRKLTLVNF